MFGEDHFSFKSLSHHHTNIRNCRIIELPRIVDSKDGIISVAEARRHIPFDIRRVYYIYGLNYFHSIRGLHAHRKLEQALFCINGSVRIDLDDGWQQTSMKLDRPNMGLYLGVELWHKMGDFAQNCILLVLASDYFDESDYIRSYEEFLDLVRNR
jgi:dTDP-4-dehydrorhamnose 3,5-epimerase-like enzyme